MIIRNLNAVAGYRLGSARRSLPRADRCRASPLSVMHAPWGSGSAGDTPCQNADCISGIAARQWAVLLAFHSPTSTTRQHSSGIASSDVPNAAASVGLVQSERYLGIHMREDCSWDEQLAAAALKGRGAMYVWMRALRSASPWLTAATKALVIHTRISPCMYHQRRILWHGTVGCLAAEYCG